MTGSSPKGFKKFLFAATLLASPWLASALTPAMAQVSIGISVQIAPPELPVYDQPPLPDAGYVWTPGFWAYSQEVGYYWVPGTWVEPPAPDVLWTPPYWAWDNGAYIFHDGYWGPTVGFYGDVDYGYGYDGVGYQGGRWQGHDFLYNRTVNNFGSIHVTNVYEQNVTPASTSHVSFVGGAGGIRAEPTAQERAAEHEHHLAATADQAKQVEAVAKNPAFAAKQNNGHPDIAATSRAGQLSGAGVVHARATAAEEHPAASGAAPKQEETPAAREAGHPEAGHPEAVRPGEAAPAAPTEAKPAETRPAETRPAETKPAEAPRAEPKPAETPREASRPAVTPAEQPRAAETPAEQPRVRAPEAPAAAPAQRPAEVRPETPAEARPEAVHPEAAHPEAAHPEAAHPEAARPAPEREAPAPAAPHPAAPPARPPEAPHPAAPPPAAQAPHPAPAPAAKDDDKKPPS